MWNNMMLLCTEADEQRENHQEVEGNLVLGFATEGECELISMKVMGTAESDIDDVFGIGYKTEDGYRIDVRVHGEQFLDGKELVRLMKLEGSPAYGGEYDDEHFIYVASDSDSYTVVSSNHIMMPSEPCTLRMTATLEEDIKDGGALVPGLHFVSKGGGAIALRAPTSGVGDVEMSLLKSSGYVFSKFMHKPTTEYMELPIRYDSVSLSIGTGVCSEPYNGQSVSFPLGDYPLTASFDGSVCDELDCVTGILTRRMGGKVINGETDISEAMYNSIPCFLIRLPEVAGEGVVNVGGYLESDYDMFAEFGDCILMSPDRDFAYFRFYDDAELEDAISELDGKLLLYPLTEEKQIQLGDHLDADLPAGAHYAEVCAPFGADIKITYTEKE